MSQLSISFDPPVPTKPRPLTRFEVWLEQNPGIYAEVVRRARRVKAAGGRVGMKAIFESIRWDVTVRTIGDEWKLNNTYAAPMARLVMERESDLEGFFETRGESK